MAPSPIVTHQDLPERAGTSPKVHPGPPQHQLDQHPEHAQWRAMRALVEGWASADKGDTLRGVPGTLGLFLPRSQKCAGDHAFLIGREFAHHHPDDGGLHMTLPREWCDAVVAKGWGEPHTWAGRPTVSPLTVLVYAPRNAKEIEVVRALLAVSEAFAGAEIV